MTTAVVEAALRGASIPSLVPTECPLCGDAEAEPVAVSRDFRQGSDRDAFLALRCGECGTVYLNPAPAAMEWDRLHSAGLEGRVRRRTIALRLARWGRSLDGAAVLDVRSPGESPLARRAQSGLDAPEADPTYALIVLNDTLEYCIDPVAELQAVRERLRPGGRVVLALNNLDSPSFRLFAGRHWGGYDFPRQRALYSSRALRLLAARAGLEVVSLSTEPGSASWVESIYRLLGDWQAPGWLASRFSGSSVAAPALFGVVERLLQWRGRASVVVVALGRPA